MDSLINYLKKSKKEILKELNIQAKQKIVLYAPTFDVGLWPWENKYDEFESLCKYCYNNNLILIIRFHQFAKLNRKRVKKILRKYKNILWLDMKDEPDTMKLLSITDILITDWSSIYTEFFLAKRPIIYLETNKKYFTEKRGKPEIPSSFRAGEIVHSNSEFFHALQTVLNSGNRFIEEQERLLHIIHGAVDGHASKRVFEVINKIIEKL